MIVQNMDFIVYLVPFPMTIYGMIEPCEDKAAIYINSRIPAEKQRKALKHELRHLELGHPWDQRPVHVLEDERTASPYLHNNVFTGTGELIFAKEA